MENVGQLKVNPQTESKKANFLTQLNEIKVGVIPLPLYAALATIVFLAAYFSKLPTDMIGGFAVIIVLGVLLGDIGLRVPILKDIGGPAILAIFVPSTMVFMNWFNPNSMEAVHVLMKESNFLYFYISVLVAGSILGMNRTVLIKGFSRMFVPLVLGTLVSVGAGLLVGMAFGYSAYHTFFFIIVPIIGGGIGEGILPLSIAYSAILGESSATYVSMMIPAAIIGNVVAIICAGLLKRLGEKRPHLSGNGVLVKSGADNDLLNTKEEEKKIDFAQMGTGLLVACSFFIFGALMSKFVGIPGAIIMIIAAAVAKYAKLLPQKVEHGAFHLYKFVSTSLTWPLMVGLGMLYVPLNDVVKVISPGYILVCASVVIAMVGTGFFIARFMNMYPVESAIVTGCHSGLGGTGDVAILSASNRMGMMPFAQISTRLGGAATVILATLLLNFFAK
ncbi:2-hydroxycarboxylate transporter family protein [Paenibacillus sp. SC116]|uniref:2-hydroxycarboxylate transporter family protein n=1 Tax=Paenibacillus sp. SC116 TaxID=2968986 RepID=UPI00215B2E15|nr:2-hydroxycarboxylate transporter family protein [Paenibacillus sp. SC116]MCR8843293.1 2-hydroxycarboxylate transporter family protein [Paenibacillus sp. SC116]